MWKILSNAIGRVLLIVLVAAFAVWGIGDVFRGGLIGSSAAKVGKESISNQELEHAVRAETSRLQSMYGGIAPEILASLHIERNVLSGLINRSLLSQAAEDMGVIVGDATVGEQIRHFPAFQNKEGVFDETLFKYYLRANGMSEKSFVAGLRTDYAIDLLIQGLAAEAIVPAQEIAMLAVYEEESRQADMFTLPSDYVKKVPEPSDAELIQFYENEKSLFSAPEYREITYLVLQRKDAEEHVSVTEEQLKQEFETRYAGHEEPENRELQQIVVEKETLAKEIAGLLKAGKDFAAVAKEKAGISAKDLTMGEVTRSDLETGGILPKESIDAIFGLKKDAFTNPVRTDLGWHIFRVANITPAQAYTFEGVRKKLNEELLIEQKEEALYTLAGRLEDDLAAGNALEETAANLGISLKKAGPLDAKGNDRQNAPISSLPPYEGFLNTAFSVTAGETSELKNVKEEDAYYIVRADSVTPAREKALDEVRGNVVKEWKKRKQAEQLYTLAKETAERMQKKQKEGKDTFEATARTLGVKVVKALTLKRPAVEPSEKAPAGLGAALFKLKPGEITDTFEDERGGYAIARLNTITLPGENMLKKREENIRDRFRQSFQDDMLQQLLLYLHGQYPVEVTYTPRADQQQ